MSKRRKNPRAADAAPKREKIKDIFVARPFEGLADETEWIALRELVPAASAPLTLKPEIIEEYGDRQVTLSTVLPMAWPAMTRQDGRVFVGLQRHVQSGDVSRDIAVAILCALRTTPGETVAVPGLPGPGVRLQDILVDGPLEISMHEGFEYWLDAQQAEDANVKASLERANASIYPTVRLSSAHAAYWCRVPDKAHVRWVLPDPEDAALDALARLSAAGDLLLGDGTKFAGMFRAHGLLVPVWDVPGEPDGTDWEAPLADFAKRYADVLGEKAPLDGAARRAKQGLVGRQLTLR
ncbi:DUF5926 family protein [Actinoplanes sp. NPDC051494]|uniref:DUF5926 family protein n=1 Tax=Actinoplanes sp. NPDC051494 TaxID=3363907 RepID=UPI00379A9C0F